MAIKNKRSKCLGGCGTLVIDGDECRKCRRIRLHAGAKRIYKLYKQRSHSFVGRVMNFFATKKEQYLHSKSLHWSRPKRYLVNVRQRYPQRPGLW